MKYFFGLLGGLTLTVALIAADEKKPFFSDITHQAGINYRHTNREFHNPYAKIMAGYTALGAAVAAAALAAVSAAALPVCHPYSLRIEAILSASPALVAESPKL